MCIWSMNLSLDTSGFTGDIFSPHDAKGDWRWKGEGGRAVVLSQLLSDLKCHVAIVSTLLFVCALRSYPTQLPRVGHKTLSHSAFRSPNLSGCFFTISFVG